MSKAWREAAARSVARRLLIDVEEELFGERVNGPRARALYREKGLGWVPQTGEDFRAIGHAVLLDLLDAKKLLEERIHRQRILAEKDVLTDAEKAELRVLSDQLTEVFCPEHRLDEP